MAKIFKLNKHSCSIQKLRNIPFKTTINILKFLKLFVFIWAVSFITSFTVLLVSGDCGESIPGKEGFFTHPEYPENYTSNMKCRWSTSARDEDKVKFWLEELDVEEDRDGKCNYDYLSIKFPKEERPAKFCGRKTKYAEEGRTPYYNGTGIPKIQFVSDDSVEMGGFKIRFKIDRYDYCKSSPCENDGSCILDDSILINGFYCKCEEGFGGQLCESDTNECASNPCLNGGTCSTPDFNMYECACPEGTSGTNCEIDEDECVSEPCFNGGTCIDSLNSYTCKCAQGFTGSLCKTEIDECESSPCMHEGRCVDKTNKYLCECAAGYEGKQCEFEIDECSSDPCLNDGICKDKISAFECECKSGYSGDRCEKDTDECLSSPCLNNGRCVDKIDRFECNCAEGYSGSTCEIELDECDSSPCKNDAYCIDYPASFYCDCRKGYDGVFCEIDMCEPNPCNNNGVCMRKSSRKIECNCSPGFYGSNCNQRDPVKPDTNKNQEEPKQSLAKPKKHSLDDHVNNDPPKNTPNEKSEDTESENDENKDDNNNYAIALAFSIVSMFMMLALVCMISYWLLSRKKKSDVEKSSSKKRNDQDFTKKKTRRKSHYSARKRRQSRIAVTQSSLNSSDEFYKNDISLEDFDDYQKKSTVKRPSMIMKADNKEPMAFVGNFSETDRIIFPSSFNEDIITSSPKKKPARISYIHLPEASNQVQIGNDIKRSSVFERPHASPQNYTPSTNYETPPYKNTARDVYDDDISLQSYSSSRTSGEDSYASQSPTSSEEDTKHIPKKETFLDIDKQQNSSYISQNSSEDVKELPKKNISQIPHKQQNLANKPRNSLKEKPSLHWNARDDNRLNNIPVEHHFIPEVDSEIDTGVAKASENIKDQLNWKHKERVNINKIHPTSKFENNVMKTENYLSDEKKQPQKKVQFKGVSNFRTSKGKFDTSKRTISKFVPSRNRRDSTSSGVYTSESTRKENKDLDKNNVKQSQAEPIKSEILISEKEKRNENKKLKVINRSYQNFNNENNLGLNRENAFVKKL